MGVFLNINWPFADIGSQSLHFSWGQDGYLLTQSGLLEFTSYVTPVGKMAIMNVTSSFVGVSNNPPTIIQQGLYNSITPIKFQKEEKEDQRSKYWSNCNL